MSVKWNTKRQCVETIQEEPTVDDNSEQGVYG